MEKPGQIESLARGLFTGEVATEHLFPFPTLSSEQKEFAGEIIDAVNRFFEERVDSAALDEKGEIPLEILKELGGLGLCGLGVAEEFGGMALDDTLYARIFSQVCSIDGAVATTLGAHQSIGYKALLLAGTEEQKAKYLPRLASGEHYASFCLTEPGSGSDAYSIKTKAIANDDGTFTINGQKLWITNAGFADFFTVFCKTDHLIDGKQVEKISCFIVERGMPGLSFGAAEKKMGIKASDTRAVFFDNVVVPSENIIGELGKGFKLAMNILNTGRLSLGAGCLGAIKQALSLATNHATGRKQFDRPIAEFGMIQDKLATMSALAYAAESTVFLTSGNMTKGLKDYSLESAICKIYSSEALWTSLDMALQIAAGNGYMQEYPYERWMRDGRINLIFEGTNEILRCFIALSGFQKPSELLKDLGKIADVPSALNAPIKSLGILTDFAKRRLGRMFPTRVLTGVHEKLDDEARLFSQAINEFAIQVENTLIKYGKKIIGNELPQKRIAEMAIDLYVMMAVLSRTTTFLKSDEHQQTDKDYYLNMCKLAFKMNYQRFRKNAKEMQNNSDQLIKELSKDVCSRGGYGTDILQD